jgi:hypothetical protein
MKKEYIIGGLALVGGIVLVSYLLKPKAPRRNSEGFFSVDGTLPGPSKSQRWCARKNADGSVSYVTNNFSPTCGKGWKAVKYFGDRTGI